MKLTVAVCTYRRFDWLITCLEHLKKQSLPQEAFQILVVDNSLEPEKSGAFREKLSGFSNLEYILTDRAGLSYARNVALEKCETPFIVYIDDDALAAETWAEEILNTFDRYPGAGVAGGKVIPIWENDPPEWLVGDLLHPLAVVDWGDDDLFITTCDHTRWLVGANIAYRTDALRKVGGFSTSLGRTRNLLLAHEELSVNKAIEALGHQIVYAPGIRVDHLVQAERTSKPWLFRNAMWEGASRVLLENEHIDVDADNLAEILANSFEVLHTTYSAEDTPESVLNVCAEFRDRGRTECMQLLGPDAASPYVENETEWPVIYIITPCFNAADTIDQTVLSVISQEGPFSIRYHVQDGNSQDGTVDKLEKWTALLKGDGRHLVQCRHVVFTYDSRPDEGMYHAISESVEVMGIPQPGIMAWLNADDYFLPGTLATIQTAFSSAIDISWIIGPIYLFDDTKKTVTWNIYAYPNAVITDGLCDGYHWQFVQQEGIFWKKELWDKAGGLNLDLKYAADWDLWRRFAGCSMPVQTKFPLATYRKRPGQISEQHMDFYLEEIEGNAPFEERKKKLSALAENPQNLWIQWLAVAKDGTYRVEKKQIDIENIPLCTKNHYKEFAREVFEKVGFPEHPGYPIYSGNLSTLHHRRKKVSVMRIFDNRITQFIYTAMPAPVQSILTKFKTGVLSPLLNAPKTGMVWFRIKKSGLFFEKYYRDKYPDVASFGNLLWHYIRYGADEGRNPNPLFDTDWYLIQSPDVRNTGVNPLDHYIRYGAREGRSTSPRFNTARYVEQNPDVKESGKNPLFHYLKYGIMEDRKK